MGRWEGGWADAQKMGKIKGAEWWRCGEVSGYFDV